MLDEAGLATVMGDGELLLVEAVDNQLQPVVRLSGEVVRPGTFQFREGMRLSDLLGQADGLTVDAYLPQAFVSRQIGAPGCIELLGQQSCVGSTRRVLVVDLHRALAGDGEHDLELRPLDHVEIRARAVSTVRPTVEVIGPVQQPGRYELTAGLRVSDLVALAGNLRPEAYQDEAELIRRVYDEATRRMELKRFRFDLGRALREGDEHDPVLQNEDRLVVRRLGNGEVTVTIDGQVPFPGTYVFPLGAQLTDLLSAAGGVLESGDLRATVFTRESVRRLQQSRLEHLRETTQRQYEGALETMVQTGQPNEGLAAKLALNQTRDLLQRMSTTQASGRVVVPFLRDDFPTSRFNLSLEDGDRLVIPRRQETVAVIGHVFNPSTFVAEDGLTVGEVLARSGGLTEFGDEERTYVIRADGNVESLAQKRSRLSFAAPLLPGLRRRTGQGRLHHDPAAPDRIRPARLQRSDPRLIGAHMRTTMDDDDHSGLSRRRFLRAGAASLAALLLPAPAGARAAAPGRTRPFDISLAEWSLHRTIQAGDLDHLDFPRVARNRFGIDAVEYVSQLFADKATDRAYLREMKRRAADVGVRSLVIMVDREGDLGHAWKWKRRRAVDRHRHWLDAARSLGCHSIRVNAVSSGSFAEQLSRAAEGIRRLTDHAAALDLNVIVENHGGLSSDGYWLSALVRRVDHSRCGTLPDFGNFRLEGGRLYDRYLGVRQLMRYAKGVSAKSHDFDEAGNEIHTDYRRMLQIVIESGYRGYVGIEYEGRHLPEFEGVHRTQRLLERVRGELAERPGYDGDPSPEWSGPHGPAPAGRDQEPSP
jgi:protein involved in polysaccharide export with SLBB domain/sugar phosphate isomerase/epimerase